MKSKYEFHSTQERSGIMRKIKSKNTTPELLLRKELWKRGIRYRIHYWDLPGKPDIVFPKHKLAVFVDGEFWHGYKWKEKKEKIKTNREYWIPKIEGNMTRDKKNSSLLIKMGWKVLRFWEKEIRNDINRCLEEIIKVIAVGINEK